MTTTRHEIIRGGFTPGSFRATCICGWTVEDASMVGRARAIMAHYKDRNADPRTGEERPAAPGCSCGHDNHDGLVCHHVSGEDEPTYCDCDRTDIGMES